MSKKEFKYNIKISEENIEIIKYFERFHLGKQKINSLIYGKKVYVNNVVVNDGNYILKNEDILKIIEDVDDLKFYNLKVKVLYEDKHILVVNKPAKILIHSDGNTFKTLTNAVHNYLNKTYQQAYAYAIHRIDFETTGLVIFAKDPLTLSYLSVEIEKHNLFKEYICLCHNKFECLRGKIESKIARDRHSNKQIISEKGKEAVSFYEVLDNDVISKVNVIIQNGRTHQIRVHLKSINHPIVGDSLYGQEINDDLKLHFKRVKFYHPFKEKEIIVECKEDF